MSLRAFHVFFITISTILALAFGGWELLAFSRERGPNELIMALGGFVCGGVLIAYGRWFLHKLKGIT